MNTPVPLPLRPLAGNRAAPDEVLLRLLTAPDEAVTREVARRTHLSQAVAEAVLTHPDPAVRKAFAANPYADPEQRARLIDDPSARVHLALGMGALPDGYAPVRPLPDHVYQRLLAHEQPLVRMETLQSPILPPRVLAGLAEHEDPAFRQAACRAWELLTPTAREALFHDEDPEVRHAALLAVPHPDPAQTAQLLAELGGHWKLSGLLARADLSPELAERLMADPEHHGELAGNPTLPAHLFPVLAASADDRVRLVLSGRPELTEAERLRIAPLITADQRLAPLSWVLEGRDDPELLRRCATSGHVWLRRSAAACPELPADLVGPLARDEDFAVRLLLAENHPRAPAELLLDLYLTGTHRAVDVLVRHPGFPVRGLAARFAGDEDPVRRRLALLDPDLSTQQLEGLSRAPGTVAQAAADPRFPLPSLRRLLADPATASAAAVNPALPVADMLGLLDRAGL